MDTVGPMSYCDLNAMLDAAYPKGALSHWKSSFLAQLSDDAIDTMIDRFARSPSPMDQMLLEHLHGAATRVGAGDTAFPHRAAGYNFLVVSEWMDPAQTDRGVAWARDTDEAGDAAAAAYGSNYLRLRELKTKYDPSNFFHMNQNIPPMS